MNYTSNSLDIKKKKKKKKKKNKKKKKKKNKNNRLSRDIEVTNNKHIHSNNRP